MNIRFYEWPSSKGYFLVLCDGMGGQLGNVNTQKEIPTIQFYPYTTTLRADEQTRTEIYRVANAFAAEKQALRDIARRLKS